MSSRFATFALIVAVLLSVRGMPARSMVRAAGERPVTFKATTGAYVISFRTGDGALHVKRGGTSASLAIRPFGTSKKLNLLYGVKKARHTQTSWILTGQGAWARFTLAVSLFPSTPGLIRYRLTVTPTKEVSLSARPQADVRLEGAPSSSLHAYTAAPPVAGSSIFLSAASLNGSILYLEDFTSLGSYFDRTHSGAAASNFSFPRARTEGALVGVQGPSFGYIPPPTSLSDLPRGKTTAVLDSYLYLLSGMPTDEASMADTYLTLLGTVYQHLPKPSLPSADWKQLAARAATDLADPANVVTLNGLRYLRSYVSDTRSSPELITQAGVLAAVKAYEARYRVSVPLDAMLEENLSSFYDPAFHTVKNGLGHDPEAREESWYFVGNLISLLQAAQNGSSGARDLLLNSVDGAIALAHTNNYEFPQSFRYSDWNGGETGLQPDVAGGYAWLMLGLHDLTGDGKYLDEAKASIRHVAGKGFELTYEAHMTAYTADVAQRLYTMTGDTSYRDYARLALANLFHVTRLWDCTYGLCRKGAGYHTYFGVNILPWGDYVAMLEQYQAWLGLRDYMKYAEGEPTYVRDLVQGFLVSTPSMMQYALPPLLPSGVVSSAAGLYDFVPRNQPAWYIPVEDLRTGEKQSGIIGQEIYGAGGSFVFAAYAPP